IDLSGTLPPNGILAPGASTSGHTVTVRNHDGLRVIFDSSVTAVPSPTAPPIFDSDPSTQATVGQAYTYQIVAPAPAAAQLPFVLARGPSGMTVDPATGLLTWTPTLASPGQALVVLQAYNALGAHSTQAFAVQVAGINQAPTFDLLPDKVEGMEGQALSIAIHASDAEGDPLVYWADGVPGGAAFDADRQVMHWTPDFQSAGTFTIRFTASAGLHRTIGETTLLVAPGNQAPTLVRPVDRTVLQNAPMRIQLHASDSDGDPLTFASPRLPFGAGLDPKTGLFTWTPAFAQQGTYSVAFTVSDGPNTVSQMTNITLLHVDTPPVFDDPGMLQIEEGQPISFRA